MVESSDIDGSATLDLEELSVGKKQREALKGYFMPLQEGGPVAGWTVKVSRRAVGTVVASAM